MTEIPTTDTLVTAATPALTVDYAKQHIRALGADDDELIAAYITAAAQYFTSQTGRPLLVETRRLGMEAFPFVGASGMGARIELPHPPLIQVRSVKYINSSGVLTSFDDGASPATPYWRATTYAGPYGRRGYVEPKAGVVWPIARLETDGVQILYDCGYGDTPDEVPDVARGILCYLVAQFDTFRTAAQETDRGGLVEVPFGVQTLLDGLRTSALSTQVLRSTGAWTVPTT